MRCSSGCSACGLCSKTSAATGEWAQFDAAIAQNKRDFDTRFAKAQVLAAEGQWTHSMDELLEIIMRDKAWNDQAAAQAVCRHPGADCSRQTQKARCGARQKRGRH